MYSLFNAVALSEHSFVCDRSVKRFLLGRVMYDGCGCFWWKRRLRCWCDRQCLSERGKPSSPDLGGEGFVQFAGSFQSNRCQSHFCHMSSYDTADQSARRIHHRDKSQDDSPMFQTQSANRSMCIYARCRWRFYSCGCRGEPRRQKRRQQLADVYHLRFFKVWYSYGVCVSVGTAENTGQKITEICLN